MTTPSVTVVELTDDELRLVNNALHSFLNVFGHEQADIVRAVEKLLTKLANPPAVSATPAQVASVADG